ncbi:MAG: peroxiredoxin, partial [Alphaproteobacteria bacterium]
PAMAVKPRQSVPALDLPLTGGGRYKLGAVPPERFTLLVIYRGLHCPVCSRYMAAFHGMLDDFAERGVEVVAVSADPEDRAIKAKQDWGLANMKVAYGFGIDAARAWGLYISQAIKDTEPATFTEPGLFLITSDGKLQMAVLNSMPHLRPAPEEVLKTVDFIIDRTYLARGEA